MSLGEIEVERQLIGNPDFAPLVPREEDRATSDRAYPSGLAMLNRADDTVLMALTKSDAERKSLDVKSLETLTADQLKDLLLEYFRQADDDLRQPGISDEFLWRQEHLRAEILALQDDYIRRGAERDVALGIAALVHAQQTKYGSPDQPVVATRHTKQSAGLEIINRRIAETNVRTWVSVQSRADLSISAFRLVGFQAGILDGEVLIEPVLRNTVGEFGVMPINHFPTTTRIYRSVYDDVA